MPNWRKREDWKKGEKRVDFSLSGNLAREGNRGGKKKLGLEESGRRGGEAYLVRGILSNVTPHYQEISIKKRVGGKRNAGKMFEEEEKTPSPMAS